ncbi:MAG TPA: hypothetical protein VIF60_01795 [Burkholderiaceae bacterium]|jgi:hypothetical protein
MSIDARHGVFSVRRPKREVVDVVEAPRKDDGLGHLLQIRKQRIERFERESVLARGQWRNARATLHAAKERWRDAKRDAAEFWRCARSDFLRMNMTSGDFRKAKAIYERMKETAAQLHLECGEAIGPCKKIRAEFFTAKKSANEATRQFEKLGILRGELARVDAEREQTT